MQGVRKSLWPYGTKAALLMAPVVWLALLLAILILRRYLGWAVNGTGWVLLTLLLAGLVPLALLIVDNMISSRAVLDIKGVKLDFSQSQLGQAPIQLPDNAGRPTPVIADSSPMQIVAALEDATAHELVCLDLRDGSGWWMTRLLALCAGAVRAGAPKAIVFVGVKENAPGAFLGWAPTTALLEALAEDPRGRGPASVSYGQLYQRAAWLAKQIAFFSEPELPAAPAAVFAMAPQPLQPTPEIRRYLEQPDYRRLGEAALEQILMDLCAQYRLEDPPERLTYGRLQDQFGHCLCHAAIDLDRTQEDPVTAFLALDAEYVAITRSGRYEGILESAAVTRRLMSRVLELA